MSAFSLFEVDFNLFDLSVEPEWAPIEVIERNYRAEIHADIEGFAGRKRRRHRALDRAAANLVTIYFEDDIRGSTGLGDCGIHLDGMLATRPTFSLERMIVRSMIIILYS